MTTSETPKLIEWTPDLSVGIPRIDSQHQKLIGLMNELHAAMLAGRGANVLGKTLDGLVDYTVSHFTFEEKLLKDTGYPRFEEHRAEHAKLVASVQSLQCEWRAGKLAISLDIMNFLKQWLSGHILNADKSYQAHLTSAGVK